MRSRLMISGGLASPRAAHSGNLSIRIAFTIFLLTATAAWSATPLPAAKPILTAVELQAAAHEVPVRKIDFVVPSQKREDAESIFSERFFNQPEETRYSGVTNEGWEKKWQLFANALIENARKSKLPADSLSACLKTLNQGRNRQTMLWPAPAVERLPSFKPSTEKETAEIAAFNQQAKEKYQQDLKYRDEHPEEYYNEHLAIIPVAAYLAKHSKGECWIIVCKWEMIATNVSSLPLGHVMVWAMDTKSAEVVCYATCD